MFANSLMLGRHVVVTGGGSGINFQIARRFGELGGTLTLIGRSLDKLERAVATLDDEGIAASAAPADVRDAERLDEIFGKIAADGNSVDVLVNGAAGNFPAKAETLSSNGFRSVVEIDAVGTFNVCRSAFSVLRKPGGVIINISAVQALLPSANQIHVNAAKAAVDQITRSLAIEWGPIGIRAVSIAPGPVADTEGMRRLAPSEAAGAEMAQDIPLKRFATKSEIADLAVFLASDSASNITGTVVVTDGGQTLVGYRVPDLAVIGAD